MKNAYSVQNLQAPLRIIHNKVKSQNFQTKLAAFGFSGLLSCGHMYAGVHVHTQGYEVFT